MKHSVRPVSLISTLFLLLGTMLCSSSCTVKTGARITKVNPYHLQPGYAPRTEEQMIDFEYRRKTYGAVDAEDFKDRSGNYFTIHWKSENCDVPVTVQLHYRQAKTGPKMFVTEQVIQAPKRSNTTKFEIIGDDYCTRGAVTQWKASIIQNGMIVDEFKSFLWQ